MTFTPGRLADLVDSEVSWLSVRTASAVPGPEWISCAQLISDQLAGGDPTYAWRKALLDDYGREYEVEPPEQVAAMFVLMWCVQVPSLVAGVAAAVTGYSPAVSAESLAFRRHPTAHYPAEVALLSPDVLPAADAALQLSEHTTAFLAGYEPGVKLSSRQRFGAVEDELRSALGLPAEAPHTEAAAAAFGVDLGRRTRSSCCFVYALPNVQACSGCPRVSLD